MADKKIEPKALPILNMTGAFKFSTRFPSRAPHRLSGRPVTVICSHNKVKFEVDAPQDMGSEEKLFFHKFLDELAEMWSRACDEAEKKGVKPRVPSSWLG